LISLLGAIQLDNDRNILLDGDRYPINKKTAVILSRIGDGSYAARYGSGRIPKFSSC
jgi:hypothetical protein